MAKTGIDKIRLALAVLLALAVFVGLAVISGAKIPVPDYFLLSERAVKARLAPIPKHNWALHGPPSVIPDEQWAQLLEGIPDHYRWRLVKALSSEHAQAIYAKALFDAQLDNVLARSGQLMATAVRLTAHALDPIPILAAFSLCMFLRPWWRVALFAPVVALVSELALWAFDPAYESGVYQFTLGTVAAGLWLVIARRVGIAVNEAINPELKPERIKAAEQRKARIMQAIRQLFEALGPLKWPFVAASGAVWLVSVFAIMPVLDRRPELLAMFGGGSLVALAGIVVLYAVMRALTERGR